MLEFAIAAAAGAAAFLVFAALTMLRETSDATRLRLQRIAALEAPTLEQLELQRPLLDRTLRPFFERMAGLSRRLSSPKMISRTDERLARAGSPGGMSTAEFLAVKLIIAGVAAALVFVMTVVLGGNVALGTLMTVAAGGIGYIAPEFWLRARISRRRMAITLAVPDVLDLITISVRAGLGFDQAMAKVVEKMRGPLSDELRRALAEIRVGKPRRDALRDMAQRADVGPLTTFVGAIVQAEQLGVPISKVLQVQSEQLRIERRQRAEEMAAKAPIKMLFPLVGCIFPAMFIVILGPAIIIIATMLVAQ